MRTRNSSICYMCAFTDDLAGRFASPRQVHECKPERQLRLTHQPWDREFQRQSIRPAWRENFDGAGNVTLAFSILSGGVLQTGDASGTYAVSSEDAGANQVLAGVALKQ